MNAKTTATTYTYERNADGDMTGNMIANGVVVGTRDFDTVHVYVGSGRVVHAGAREVLHVTTAFESVNKWGRVTASYKPGDVIPFDAWALCGSHSTYRSGANGKARTTKEDVTCTKCLKCQLTDAES